MRAKQYLCIDLKSFYASVECVERGLDPLAADLVVADPSRSEKTICLAVSPSLKAKGVRNRCRVFEIPKHLSYIMATPRMQKYIDYSAEIYATYLQYIAKEDIHVYSIDEVFMDVTNYLPLYQCTARELGEAIRSQVLGNTGIPATCGAGDNLYLAKVALDIAAKHAADGFGNLTEESYVETLWDHEPITDFWRIGAGTARRLEGMGIRTMGQLALYPYPDALYEQFGVDAEILIDHAWGIEPVEMKHIKGYRSQSASLSSGQVLPCAYTFDEGKVIVREMADAICLDLLSQGLVCSSVTLSVGYEKDRRSGATPTPAHGTTRFGGATDSHQVICDGAVALYERIVNPETPVRRMSISANNTSPRESGQLSLFDAAEGAGKQGPQTERASQEAVLNIRERFGKNALLRGTDLLPKATQRERNQQIGGHKSGQ